MREVDLCDSVRKYLDSLDFEVHEEVPIVLDGQEVSMDFVCKGGVGTCVVEAKTTLTTSLVKQLMRVMPYANYITGAVFEPKQRSRMHEERRTILSRAGLGLWYVSAQGRVHATLTAVERKGVHTDLIDTALTPRQIGTGTAGSAGVRRKRADKWDPVRTQLAGGMFLMERELDFINHTEKIEFRRLAPRGLIDGVVCHRHESPYLYSLVEGVKAYE